MADKNRCRDGKRSSKRAQQGIHVVLLADGRGCDIVPKSEKELVAGL